MIPFLFLSRSRHGEISDGFGRMTPSTVASLALWLEHWSREPGGQIRQKANG